MYRALFFIFTSSLSPICSSLDINELALESPTRFQSNEQGVWLKDAALLTGRTEKRGSEQNLLIQTSLRLQLHNEQRREFVSIAGNTTTLERHTMRNSVRFIGSLISALHYEAELTYCSQEASAQQTRKALSLRYEKHFNQGFIDTIKVFATASETKLSGNLHENAPTYALQDFQESTPDQVQQLSRGFHATLSHTQYRIEWLNERVRADNVNPSAQDKSLLKSVSIHSQYTLSASMSLKSRLANIRQQDVQQALKRHFLSYHVGLHFVSTRGTKAYFALEQASDIRANYWDREPSVQLAANTQFNLSNAIALTIQVNQNIDTKSDEDLSGHLLLASSF